MIMIILCGYGGILFTQLDSFHILDQNEKKKTRQKPERYSQEENLEGVKLELTEKSAPLIWERDWRNLVSDEKIETIQTAALLRSARIS